MRFFFSRFCSCWRSKERLDDEEENENIEENHTEQNNNSTVIGTDQEASPESLKTTPLKVLVKLKFWDRKKGMEKHKILQEEEKCPSHNTKIDYKSDLINNDITDDRDIVERSLSDSLEEIIL